MDPEQTFIRVQERFSEMLSPKIRVALEYFFMFLAITLFCILVVMHANYVQQPGCSSELSNIKLSEAQLIQIKIASAGLWSLDESMYEVNIIPEAELNSEMQIPTKVDRDGQSWLSWIGSDMRWQSALKYWKTDNGMESERESAVSSESLKPADDDGPMTISKDAAPVRFFNSPKESLKAAIIRQGKKWHGRLSFLLRLAKKILGGLWVRTL